MVLLGAKYGTHLANMSTRIEQNSIETLIYEYHSQLAFSIITVILTTAVSLDELRTIFTLSDMVLVRKSSRTMQHGTLGHIA